MSPTRELFAAAESLALQIYPWDRLKLESEATEGVLGLSPESDARLPRAIWWAVFQLFGADDGEAFNALFPWISRAVQKDEWRAISGVAPVGTGIRELWIKEIEATRAGEEGLTIVELGDGWVRVEDPESTAALTRILKRNRPASKSAAA